MPGPSKVIVVSPDTGSDTRAARQIRLGFTREGIPAEAASAATLASGNLADAGLIILTGAGEPALELTRSTRQLRDQHAPTHAPTILFVGQGVARDQARSAGADEALELPVYLRDVVTIGRLLRGVPAPERTRIDGSLAEITGVYTLVRAVCALGRSVVLTLMRGLRRGEIRFYEGEVTSAQVGVIHGQAAFHQLLLWTEARFELEHEDLVRRQQIPLSPEELLADAERFLQGVRDASGPLSPSMVLEQDLAKLRALADKIPPEVMGVLRMFDGHRVLADVLEDSPYRVFETLRVAQRALEVELLHVVEAQRPKSTWRAVLALEEWLVGADREAVIQRTQATVVDTGPVTKVSPPQSKSARRKKKKRRANTPIPTPVVSAAAAAKADIDWAALVPRLAGAELGRLSGVIPAAQRSGEIQLRPRESREKLEALMDTGRRDRIFPSELHAPEPTVVLADAEPADAPEPIDDDGPSDGIVRPIATAPTAPLRVAPPPAAPAIDDRPEAQAGEIRGDAPPAPAGSAPEEPSVLVADLAAAHAAVAAAATATAQLDAAPTPDLASATDELGISAVREDAVAAATAFTEAEEAFFRAGQDNATSSAVHTAPVETFDDLDEGYQPLGFWDRLRGKKR